MIEPPVFSMRPRTKNSAFLDFNDHLTRGEKAAIAAPAELWDAVRGCPVGDPADPPKRYRSGVVELQGDGRQTCVCFATLAALESFFMRRGTTKLILSKQYANWVFMRAQGRGWCEGRLRLIEGMKCLAENGVCVEDLCKYFPTKKECDSAPCKRPSGDAIAAAKYGVKKYCIVDRALTDGAGPSINNSHYIESILRKNFTVILSLSLPQEFNDGIYEKFKIIDVKKRYDLEQEPGIYSHAVLIVGHDRSGDIPYFICKDSKVQAEGAKCEGYSFFSYDFVCAYANYGAVVLAVSDKMPSPELP